MKHVSLILGVIEPNNPAKREKALARLAALRAAKVCPPVGENVGSSSVTTPGSTGPRAGIPKASLAQ